MGVGLDLRLRSPAARVKVRAGRGLTGSTLCDSGGPQLVGEKLRYRQEVDPLSQE